MLKLKKVKKQIITLYSVDEFKSFIYSQNQYFKWDGTSPQLLTNSPASINFLTLSKFWFMSFNLSAMKLSCFEDLKDTLKSLCINCKYFLKLNFSLFNASMVAENAGKMQAFSKVLSKNVSKLRLNLNEKGEAFESSKLNFKELT